VSGKKSVMRIVVSICLLFVLMGCKKSAVLSDCIQSKVDRFKTSAQCTSADITEYEVYDADCNFLGTIGGFIGGPKIDRERFYTDAKFTRTIWHN
jgi:hypothetical protein